MNRTRRVDYHGTREYSGTQMAGGTQHDAAPDRVWLVICDHSIAGVWQTRREAEAAVRLRERQASPPIEHHVVGPYVLRTAKGRAR